MNLLVVDDEQHVRQLCADVAVQGPGPSCAWETCRGNLQYSSSEPAPDRNEILPLEELERRAILKTLHETSGDKLAAARILRIGKTTLYRKLKQYNMRQAEEQ